MSIVMIGNLVDPDDERDNPPHQRGLHIIVTRLGLDELIILDHYVERSRIMDRDPDRLLDYVVAETTARGAGAGRFRVDLVNDGRDWPPLDAFVIFDEPMGDEGVYYAWERDAARRYWILPDTVPAVRSWPSWALSDHPAPADEPDIDATFDASSFGPSDPRLERYLASREQARKARTDAVVEAVLAVADHVKALREESKQHHVDAMQHMTWCVEESLAATIERTADGAAQHIADAVRETGEETTADVVEAIGYAAPGRRRRLVQGVSGLRWAQRRAAREEAAQGQDEASGGR